MWTCLEKGLRNDFFLSLIKPHITYALCFRLQVWLYFWKIAQNSVWMLLCVCRCICIFVVCVCVCVKGGGSQELCFQWLFRNSWIHCRKTVLELLQIGHPYYGCLRSEVISLAWSLPACSDSHYGLILLKEYLWQYDHIEHTEKEDIWDRHQIDVWWRQGVPDFLGGGLYVHMLAL